MARSLTASGVFASDPLTLIDVGASGGINDAWYVFGEDLVAYGFDPLVAEVARLNGRRHAVGRIEYLDAFIVASSSAGRPAPWTASAWERSSALAAMKLSDLNYEKEVFNAGAVTQHSVNAYSIDEFVLSKKLTAVDVIKVDTDGFDYGVLLGAKNVLLRGEILAVAVEVGFNVPEQPESNSFTAIDRYLQGLGFTLFDLDVQRYTRAALPGRFRYDIPAQTTNGPVVWADALYFLDFVDPNFEIRRPDLKPSVVQLLKMAALFEIYSFTDCAVEILNQFEAELKRYVDLASIRDILAQETGSAGYKDHLINFEERSRARRYASFRADAETGA